ncbi:MAG: glycosyltransferase family protein [bacterium]
MKHLLLLGVGPLPFYKSEHLYGFGIRTWQFARPLLAAGHKVTLITCEFGVQRENELKLEYMHDPSVYGNLEHLPLPQPTPKNENVLLTRIEDVIHGSKPDGVIAAGSTIATNLAASIRPVLPLWLDMFGDLFTEVQAKSPFADSDEELQFFHRILARVLLRGDRFSVVSEIQRGVAIGQLGFLGRLNRHTLSEELVFTIPCAMDGTITPVKKRTVLRGREVENSDFLILCSGGFNTWADIETLFFGIEGAMEKNPRIHCIVTGGSITGHHEAGFNRFRSLISKSSYEKRFHLLGWVPNEDVPEITMECNLGLNVDLPIYESQVGSRNRMLLWMQCGLPILTTVTTELSRILSQNDLVIGVPTRKDKLIARKILEVSQDQEPLKQMAARARQFAYEYFTFEETVQPLLHWAENPQRAADNAERENQDWEPLNPVDLMWHEWAFPGQTFGKNSAQTNHHYPNLKNWLKKMIGS